MVQQKIVMKVPMKKEKDRSKAMKIAVGIIGVSSVKIRGEDRDIVVVVGNEVDIVNLARSLIKRFGSATVVRVEKLTGVLDDGEGEDGYDVGQALMVQAQPSYYYYNNNIPPPQYPPPYYNYYSYERPVYDSNCSIM